MESHFLWMREIEKLLKLIRNCCCRRCMERSVRPTQSLMRFVRTVRSALKDWTKPRHQTTNWINWCVFTSQTFVCWVGHSKNYNKRCQRTTRVSVSILYNATELKRGYSCRLAELLVCKVEILGLSLFLWDSFFVRDHEQVLHSVAWRHRVMLGRLKEEIEEEIR